MRILLVITGLEVGGAERIVVNLADKAHLEGHEVKVAYLVGRVELKPSNIGIEIISLKMMSYSSTFKALWRLVGLIRTFKPDVVHSHMIHANLLARIARVFVKFPRLVCSAHSSDEGGKIRMLLYRLTNRFGDVFTNVSKEAAQRLEASGAAPTDSIVPVLNGIDIALFRRFNVKKNELFNIVAVGRLVEAKDYPNLLNAITFLSKRNGNFKLKIVGDGLLREQLEDMSRKLGVFHKVEWLGVRNDIPELLNQADVFVLSSAWEGFGLVVAEAMACELPVVATDCGGVKEVVGDERWLVKTKDPIALCEKIEAVMYLNNNEREQLGIRNRERVVALYSLDAMYFKYKKLYAV